MNTNAVADLARRPGSPAMWWIAAVATVELGFIAGLATQLSDIAGLTADWPSADNAAPNLMPSVGPTGGNLPLSTLLRQTAR